MNKFKNLFQNDSDQGGNEETGIVDDVIIF